MEKREEKLLAAGRAGSIQVNVWGMLRDCQVVSCGWRSCGWQEARETGGGYAVRMLKVMLYSEDKGKLKVSD